MEVNPLCVILVKSDSKGDRLLFRYPFHVQENKEPANTRRKNPYTLPVIEDLLQSPTAPTSNVNKGYLTGFTDEVLSSLFAVKPELCNRKFELKVNDVRFVGHPTLLQLNKTLDDTLINIVFALQALASHSVVKCYHDLSRRIGIALKHEEKRCRYISEEIMHMMLAHDDGYASDPEATFQTILEKCNLAVNIKKMYEDLCNTGLVSIRINKWIPLTFCLPQKVHQWHLGGKIIEPEDIDISLMSLRPYHSLLLLCPAQYMSDFISLDGSPSLIRLLSQYSPLKNLQTLATDADLTLSHVFELTAHLVYWAKATVIYPICGTNKYVISPEAPVNLNSNLLNKFSENFTGMSLIKVISEFSLPTTLGSKCNPLYNPIQQTELVQMTIWMLQHHLLTQLHTYIQIMPTENGCVSSHHNFSSEKLENGYVSNQFDLKPARNVRTVSESLSDSDFKLDSDLNKNLILLPLDDEKQDYQEEQLLDFTEEERDSILKIPAANNAEDLRLFARLHRKGYYSGTHHVEEIMYLENLRRSQLLQLLDKFRDVLITYETEDPAIAMFSCS